MTLLEQLRGIVDEVYTPGTNSRFTKGEIAIPRKQVPGASPRPMVADGREGEILIDGKWVPDSDYDPALSLPKSI